MHPTGGSLRVFRQFAWLEVDSVKVALSCPTHQRVTPTVSQQVFSDFGFLGKMRSGEKLCPLVFACRCDLLAIRLATGLCAGQGFELIVSVFSFSVCVDLLVGHFEACRLAS